jgi:putative ABC transport system permease protein
VRMADASAQALRIAAIYDRSAGLGDVVLDPAFAGRHATTRDGETVFVAGGPAAGRSLARYAASHPGVAALSRPEYLATLHAFNRDEAWAVWVIVGLSVIFAAIALLNTAAMATSERRAELGTIRLLGGTGFHAVRMIAIEHAATVIAALAAGAVIAGVSINAVPDGVRGIPLVVPATVVGGLVAGAAVLGLAAAAITTRIALSASPTAAMRAQE